MAGHIERLFICEKPSLAKAIATGLPGRPVRRKTHIEVGSDVLTWCFGHLFEQAPPEAYGEQYKRWTLDSLPIVPKQWIVAPKDSAKAQVSQIKRLLSQARQVVHAGDPDREGQLIVDELLSYLGNRHPVQRIWLNAYDEASVRKALARLSDNLGYANLSQSALARSRADWLIGMNLTRAYTLNASKRGYRGVVSIGRVQTPTLALVVKRDLEIEAFVPKPYYLDVAEFEHDQGRFHAKWLPRKGQAGVDEEGHLVDRSVAQALAEKVRGKPGKIAAYETQAKSASPPLPYSLSKLQQTASARFGLNAKQTLDICQALYETHKLTTYPRSDCQYLPADQLAEADLVLSAVARTAPEYQALITGASTRIKSPCWNDSKVSAHHAIIPTQQQGSSARLSEIERKVYDLIVRAYLAQFYPRHEYQQTRVAVICESEMFTASGRVTLKPGWKVVMGESGRTGAKAKTDEGEQGLPRMGKGDSVECLEIEVERHETKPPARYTDGLLIKDMSEVHRLVTNPEVKARLKDTAGLGTEATRAAIIETLLKRRFIVKEGRKHLISTEAARQLIAGLPKQLKDPGLTALWEDNLEAIADGEVSHEAFLKHQIRFLTKMIEIACSTPLELDNAQTPTAVPGRRGRGDA